MNAQKLYEFLSKIPQEKRREMPVILRGVQLESFDRAEESTFGSLGLELPCILLESDREINEAA